MVTDAKYINIINHQILCPLSFFLTPFTFTGSTLILLICLIHFITRYVRKYDTVLGQAGGRLSIVFVLAFILIRSVLGSTSVELVALNPATPETLYCTIDMNTPKIVQAFQHISHIFSEVTDILVHLGWIITVCIYIINTIRCKSSYFYDRIEPQLNPSVKQPYSSNIVVYQSNSVGIDHRHSIVIIPTDSIDETNGANDTIRSPITNKQRHSDLSLIVLSIGISSIILYSPMIILKYSSMYFLLFGKNILSEQTVTILQNLHHTTHLLCLCFRFIPYLFFDRRLHVFIHQLIGIQCISTFHGSRGYWGKRRFRRRHRYVWNCQCRRRQKILEIQDEQEPADPFS